MAKDQETIQGEVAEPTPRESVSGFLAAAWRRKVLESLRAKVLGVVVKGADTRAGYGRYGYYGGTRGALNYYGLVRPEFEFRNSIRGLQRQTASDAEALANLQPGSILPSTGHQAVFLNTGGYFQGRGGPVPAARPGTTLGQTPKQTAPRR